jgi:hypothetical protein
VNEPQPDPAHQGLVLDDLSRERLDEGRRILARLESERDAAPETFEVSDGLAQLPVEQLRCLLFAVAERIAGAGDLGNPSWVARDCFWALEDLDLDLAVGDVRVLAAAAEPGESSLGEVWRPFRLVVALVAGLLADGAIGAGALADVVANQVLAWNAMEYFGFGWTDYRQHVAEIRDKALALAGWPPAPPPTEGIVGRDDGYGQAAIARLGHLPDWPAGVAALLEHCATAKPARPGPRWEKVCRQRLDAVGDASGLLRDLLDLLLTTDPVSFLTDSGRRLVLVGYNEQLVKGLVWAAGLLDADWLPAMLSAVATRCLRLCSGHVFRETPVPAEKIPYACSWALARSGSDDSLLALAKIGQATANRSVLRHLGKLLAEVAARRGISPDSLLERLTPDHGLDGTGQVSVVADGAQWTVRLDDRDGAVLAGPAGAADPPAPVAELLAEVQATVSAARNRLDEMFAAGREWHVEDFLDCHVRHPVTGWLATRMVWMFTTRDGPTLTGFPDLDGRSLRTSSGPEPIPAGSLVRLWHPVSASGDELGQLRRLAASLGIVQPIRQLWRETYHLTDAERRLGLYSDRYAGHVLRFGQFYGLARRRGWGGGFLSGAWDGGDTAVARRDYPAVGLRASWAIAQLDQLSTDVAVDLCITERVAFSPLDDKEGAPIPLTEVPAEVFSEAMRDLHLCVSLTTVANDPIWLEEYRGRPILDQYWDSIASGGLDQLREHRYEALAQAYGDAGEDGRFRLTDRELIVRGSLASYRIDLATANVRTEPAGKWLSFDSRLSPEVAYRHQILYLPALDDDEILRRIVIRAAILVDDDQLASPKLLRQIRG